MKLRMKRIIKVVLFIALFFCLFYVATRTLKLKNDRGILEMESYYRLSEDDFDVLNIGSSHVGVNVDAQILMEKYGIKVYNLWATDQPAWNSYYWLNEALKYQTPELICMEVYIVGQDTDYSEYGYAINNVMGMRPSQDKYEAVKESFSEELWQDVMLEWPIYHTRYSELGEDDFKGYFWNFEMVSANIDSGYGIYEEEAPQLITEDQTESLNQKQEKYLRKIIELCKEKNIPLLLFATPYNASEIEQKRLNQIGKIAEEYGDGVTYKNFLYDIDEIPMDFAMDYVDGAGHFNNYGIEKFTMYYGRYLKDNFDIPVREESYAGAFDLQKLYNCAYRMPEMFSGNGATAYVDTNQTLYDDPDRSWTLFADFATDIFSDEQIYFSCYAEQPDAYRGLLVKREEDTLYIVLGDNYYVDVPVPEEGFAHLTISKQSDVYNIYLNGEKILEDAATSCSGYDGPLLVGCEQDENGEPYRFSASTVYELEVYNEVVSEKDIIRWQNQERSSAAEMAASIQETFDYYLEEEFVGNGLDKYIDTGIQLYDNPLKNWTVLTEIDLTCDKSASDLVYLSCFNEQADNYRGLILRYKDDKLELVLGNTYYLDIPDSGNDTMKIVIEKNEGTYTVFVDGEEFASDIESFCSSYMGSLLIGCQEESDLPIRVSPVTVKRLEVYDELVPAEEVAGW